MTGPWRRRLRLLGQAVALVLPLIVFFAVYERVMVDTNLRQLRLALTVFQQAPDVSRAEAAMALVDQNLLYTIALAQPSPVELATLEYAKTVLAGDPQRSVADAQAMVSDAVAQRLAARGGVVGTLDDLNNTIQRVLQRVALMPRAVLRRSPLSDEINLELLRQALADERLGEFAKAERAFEQLLREFPAYRGRDDLLFVGQFPLLGEQVAAVFIETFRLLAQCALAAFEYLARFRKVGLCDLVLLGLFPIGPDESAEPPGVLGGLRQRFHRLAGLVVRGQRRE